MSDPVQSIRPLIRCLGFNATVNKVDLIIVSQWLKEVVIQYSPLESLCDAQTLQLINIQSFVVQINSICTKKQHIGTPISPLSPFFRSSGLMIAVCVDLDTMCFSKHSLLRSKVSLGMLGFPWNR